LGKLPRLQSLSKIERGHQWKCESMMCMGCPPCRPVIQVF
jgi:hypothetical protein